MVVNLDELALSEIIEVQSHLKTGCVVFRKLVEGINMLLGEMRVVDEQPHPLDVGVLPESLAREMPRIEIVDPRVRICC